MPLGAAAVLLTALFFFSWGAAALLLAMVLVDTTPLPLAGLMLTIGVLGFLWAGPRVPKRKRPDRSY